MTRAVVIVLEQSIELHTLARGLVNTSWNSKGFFSSQNIVGFIFVKLILFNDISSMCNDKLWSIPQTSTIHLELLRIEIHLLCSYFIRSNKILEVCRMKISLQLPRVRSDQKTEIIWVATPTLLHQYYLIDMQCKNDRGEVSPLVTGL